MRVQSLFALAFLLSLTSATQAQGLTRRAPARTEGSTTEAYEREPVVVRESTVSFEVQSRLGAGGTVLETTTDVPGAPSRDGTVGVDGHLGLSLSLHERNTGLGASIGYTHVFVGVASHYGTHAFDARLSERYAFVRGRTGGAHRLELSVLAEAGVAGAIGGGSSGCILGCQGFVYETVRTSLAGFVGGAGLELQVGAFLLGLAVEYRYMAAVDATRAVASQEDLLGVLRVGVIADL